MLDGGLSEALKETIEQADWWTPATAAELFAPNFNRSTLLRWIEDDDCAPLWLSEDDIAWLVEDRRPCLTHAEQARLLGNLFLLDDAEPLRCRIIERLNELAPHLTAEEKAFPQLRRLQRKEPAKAVAAIPTASGPAVQPTPEPTASKLVIRRASDIRPVRVEWVWPNRIPLGKCTILAGHGGLGKTTALLDIAARISRGAAWPCNEGRAPLGSVVYFSAEDDAADTLVPRLMAANADLTKIVIVSAVRKDDGQGNRAFHLQADLQELESCLATIGDVRLVIFDPISSYFGKTDTYRNSEVRAVLEPLGEAAARHKVAIIGNTHLAKGGAGRAAHKILDSVAITAHSRATIMVAEDTEDTDRRLFLPAKANLGPMRAGLAFRIHSRTVDAAAQIGGSYMEWEQETVSITADEAFGALDKKGRTPKERNEASQFLREFLADGPKGTADVLAAGVAAGHTEITIRRASKAIGARSSKTGVRDGWEWKLPVARTPRGGSFE